MTSPDDNDDTTSPEDALRREQTAAILGIAVATLDAMRYRGEGPPFFRIGGRHIRFVRRDVIAYRDAHTVGKVSK